MDPKIRENILSKLSDIESNIRELKTLISINATNEITMIAPKDPSKTKLQTEDLGKKFEKAICYALNIPYDGKYSYGEEWPKEFAESRLGELHKLFPSSCTHTAKNGERYDYTYTNGDVTRHLSAKSVKLSKRKNAKNAKSKVAPQVIGQPSVEKFATYIGCDQTETSVRDKVITDPYCVLKLMEDYTFDSEILYYNEKTNKICYIRKHTDIDWTKYSLSFTQDWRTSGKNSTNIKLHYQDKDVSIVEIQKHSKGRQNMAIRWYFDDVLEIFKDHFDIHYL
jgi:hypothetical protein